MNQDKLPFLPADILLPRDCAYSKWSVVACDQYTSQPEYWQRVEERVGSAPSTLRLILPESRLEGPDTQADITEINSTMSRYLREGRFQVHPDAVFYIERTLDGGKVRRGLVGRIDLEQYDYEPGSAAPIRATEGTVLSRIPPRVAVRKNAPIELPHVMLLADDPGRTVIEPLSGQTAEMRPLYDFDLMERGGHIRGWELTAEQWGQTARALAALADPDAFNARYRTSGLPVMLFAVGDGNHSLATAKECYERQKKLCPPEQWDSLPARYALVELNNLHDDSLEFEPIHRVVFGAGGAAGRLGRLLPRQQPDRPPGGPSAGLGGQRPGGDRVGPSALRTASRGHLAALPGRVPSLPSRGPGGLHPRRGCGAQPGRPAGHRGVPAARHGQGGAVPHRDPRRGAAPQDLLYGGGPRQAVLSGGPAHPGLSDEVILWRYRPLPS